MLLIEWTSTEGIAMGLAGWPSCRLRDRVLLSIRGWAVPVIPQGLLCWSCQALACRQGAGWTPPAVGWPSGVTTPPPAGHAPLSLLSCLSCTSELVGRPAEAACSRRLHGKRALLWRLGVGVGVWAETLSTRLWSDAAWRVAVTKMWPLWVPHGSLAFHLLIPSDPRERVDFPRASGPRRSAW